MFKTSSATQAGIGPSRRRCSRCATQHLGDSIGTVCAAMVCAALIRLVVVLARYKYLAAPTLEHGDFGAEVGWVARSLTRHLGFSSPFFPQSGPTALVPPVFPFVLSLVFRVFGLYTSGSALVILLFQSACSVVTCVPVFLIGRQIHSQRAGKIAVWIWALYPFSIYYGSGEIWDYAPTAMLFTAIVTLLLRLRSESPLLQWLATGLLLGLGGLTNPSILPAAGLLMVFVISARVHQWRQSLWKGALLLLGAFLVLLPWALRNERVLGAWIPVRDGFWLEAWAGNHGDTFVTNPASAHPASNSVEMALFLEQGELNYLKNKRSLTTDWILHHREEFLQTTARRAFRFWTGFWSFNPAYLRKEPFDIPACLLCTSITILMLMGFNVLRRESSPNFWGLASVMVLFPCPYYVTHASMDYRQPIEPLVVVLMSVGLLGIRRSSKPIHSSQIG